MEKQQFWLQMDDGMDISVQKWFHEKTPKAILQLSHGMAEHIERYDHFARFLTEKDIFVYGNDHRGHGKTGDKAGIFGYFSDENGFERVTDDLLKVTEKIKSEFPAVPIILFGHSMGSFLVRRYIQKYPNQVQGVIISGTGGNPGLAGKVGKMWAQWESKKNGRDHSSPTMDRLIFGSYNKGFENGKSKFAWLTRDEQVVEAYLKDPYCGFVCTSGFFVDLLSGLETIHKDEEIQKINKALPVYIFSGAKDPVGAKTFGVKSVIHQYKKNGIHNLEYRFYDNGRHEMLNEINKEEVFQDIYNWLLTTLSI